MRVFSRLSLTAFIMALVLLAALKAFAQQPYPPPTSGGLSWHSAIALNTTNSTNVKATFGQVYAVHATNNGVTIAYLKLYNQATAPTCGSGTPLARFMIPAAAAGGAVTVSIPAGIAFGTGIGYCVTTGIADNDTAAPAATTYIIQIGYK